MSKVQRKQAATIPQNRGLDFNPPSASPRFRLPVLAFESTLLDPPPQGTSSDGSYWGSGSLRPTEKKMPALMSLSLGWVTVIGDQPRRLAVHRGFRPLQQPGVSGLISSLSSQ